MKIYISGPMTGIDYFNFPAFDKAKEYLKSQGHEVISPADINREAGIDPDKIYNDARKNRAYGIPKKTWSELPKGQNMKDIVRRDINAMLDCDCVYILNGWKDSKGARSEVSVATWAGMGIIKGA